MNLRSSLPMKLAQLKRNQSWFPVFMGITLNNEFQKVNFYLIFIGVNLTFFPQHFLGLAGMPRRYVDYPDTTSLWHNLSTIGSTISTLGVFVIWVFFMEALLSARPALFSRARNNSLE